MLSQQRARVAAFGAGTRADDGAPVLVAEGVTKVYRLPAKKGEEGGGLREVRALDDLSFDLAPGEALGVIGPNGAGKTTLLRVLSRMTPPTAGRILGWGRLASLIEPAAGLHPEMSGRRNLYLLATMSSIPRALVAERLEEIAEFAELGEFLDLPVHRYSAGMALRLAFAAVIHLDPDILIADEVLAVGDLSFQERCIRRLLRARDEGCAVLFVSHDLNAVRRICDRALWMDGGKAVEIGPTDEVLARYEQSAMAHANRRLRRQAKQSRGAEWGHIEGVRLLDEEGETITAMSCTEPATIEITFSAFTLGLQARCAVDVFAKGVLAFRSQQPEPVTIERRGVYRGMVELPASLLAETVYTVSAMVTLTHDGEERLFAAANALTFPVRELVEPPIAATARRDVGGVVRPQLRWRLRRRKG